MRLKLVLSLVVVLALSCQQESSKVQNSTSDNKEVSMSLTKDEQKNQFKILYSMIEKVFAKESENKTRSKKISNFFLKSKLSEKDKYDILKKTMIKLDVSIEDQKEIMQHLSKLKRMNIEK